LESTANPDDLVLRGDLPRLSRTTSIITSTPSAVAASPEAPSLTNIRRSKPLKYAYEKEIVLYAHHKSLDYFSTECIYSPEAFRGSARALIKNLERVRPSAILDVVRSGEDMAKLTPGYADTCAGKCGADTVVIDEEEGGCGSATGRTGGGEMAKMELQLNQDSKANEESLETEITLPRFSPVVNGHGGDTVPINLQTRKSKGLKSASHQGSKRPSSKQTMGQCERCGYLSSQKICKACVLLEGLNKNRPRVTLDQSPEEITVTEKQKGHGLPKTLAQMGIPPD
jgi:cytoplasmic tRNA 2-thiolation protein 1